MTSSMSFLLLFVTVMASLMCFSVVASNSDYMEQPCGDLCSNETAASNLCDAANGCIDLEGEEYDECSDPCWRLTAMCFRFCRRAFDRVSENCERRCNRRPTENCYDLCLADRLQGGRDRMYMRRLNRIPTESA